MPLLHAYGCYLLAEGLTLSGIVAILFCGLVMSHYTRNNLSKATAHFSLEFFEFLAALAESYVFLYLGLSIFPSLHGFHLMLVLISFVR